MTPNVSEDFGFKTEFANGFAIGSRLLRGSRRRKFDIFNAKGIERFGNLNFFGGIEESVGKLFSLSLNYQSLSESGIITRVDSMMEKFDTRDRKSSALARID